MSERLSIGDKSFDVKLRRSGNNFTLVIGEREFQGSYSKILDWGIFFKFFNFLKSISTKLLFEKGFIILPGTLSEPSLA